MNDFYRGYILSYFKDHKQHYSFLFLAQNLGLAVSSIDELVSELIEDNQLAYGSNNMLMLTPKGRLTIYRLMENTKKKELSIPKMRSR